MAGALLKLATILSLVFSILLQASSSQMTLSSDIEDDDEEYVLDSPPENFRSRSRFLASVVRKVFSLALFSQRVLVDACSVLEPSSEFLQLSYTKSSVCATNKESLYGWR
ncbi:hypothetical protein OIU79_026583 [Salix purpurea]|uniref:Uncharacterized protein n=1 Tax=Salix purpurea TaxID=77065 RepID=A0A9Q0VSA9_SALPP|nr:hypothetical protein OIU79_026583 [Salix purpurea]